MGHFFIFLYTLRHFVLVRHFLPTVGSFLTYIPLAGETDTRNKIVSFSVFGVSTNRNFSFGVVTFLVILYFILFFSYLTL